MYHNLRRHTGNTWPVAALTARSEARYRLRIAISAYHTCVQRPRYGVPVGILSYPLNGLANRGCKKFVDMFIRFDGILERDGHTDTQTDTA